MTVFSDVLNVFRFPEQPVNAEMVISHYFGNRRSPAPIAN
jgi:hypothetical protein